MPVMIKAARLFRFIATGRLIMMNKIFYAESWFPYHWIIAICNRTYPTLALQRVQIAIRLTTKRANSRYRVNAKLCQLPHQKSGTSD